MTKIKVLVTLRVAHLSSYGNTSRGKTVIDGWYQRVVCAKALLFVKIHNNLSWPIYESSTWDTLYMRTWSNWHFSFAFIIFIDRFVDDSIHLFGLSELVNPNIWNSKLPLHFWFLDTCAIDENCTRRKNLVSCTHFRKKIERLKCDEFNLIGKYITNP